MTKINVHIINLVDVGFNMQICSILFFSSSILVKFCVYLRTSSGRTQMLLLEKDILLYSNCYLFIVINRHSIHPIYTHMSTRRLMTLPLKIWKTSFYSSDLTTYPKIIFQLFYNKARRYRSVISKYRPRYFIIDCDEVLFPFFFNKFTPNPRSGFFSGKGKKKERRSFPLASKKKGRRTT